MKKLVVIVGPTAIGKTSLGIQLAKHFNTEIISADSRQFFQEMSIGTAKPTASELAQAPHHFVDNKSILERYSAGQFEKDAITKIESLFETNEVVIMVGGSGLYVDAVCNGIDDIPMDLNIRKNLNQRLEDEGLEVMQNELKELDPVSFSEVNLKNPQRVIRALEVCLASGKPYSAFKNKEKKKRPFEIIKIGLTAEREYVYERINLRVDLMMEEGLLDEVKTLLPHRELNALNTVGYKEWFKYLDGELSYDEASELLKKNTRNFAKRQFTWFRKDKSTHWIEAPYFDKAIEIII